MIRGFTDLPTSEPRSGKGKRKSIDAKQVVTGTFGRNIA